MYTGSCRYIKQDVWTCGGTRNMDKNQSQISNIHNDLDIAPDIQKKRLEWIGHPVRMNHGRVVKKIFEREEEEWEDLD